MYTSANDFQNFLTRFVVGIILSLLISKRGYDKSSLSLSGALFAIPVGLVVTVANYSFSLCLVTFFVTSSAITKFRGSRKKKLEENFKPGGQRNAVQVLCNGGVPLVIALLYIIEVGFQERPINFKKDFMASVLITSFLGALSCCNGDTWSSELGSVLSTTPRLITTLQKVPVGTNGGVSLVGLIASAIGGFVIGLVFFIYDMIFVQPQSFLSVYPKQYPVLYLSTFAGFTGSLIDSLLGAVLQYSAFCNLRKKVVCKESLTATHISGMDILSNDVVNLLSCFITTLVTPCVGFYFWSYV